MNTRTIKTKSGHVFEIIPANEELKDKVQRQLAREGIRVTLDHMDTLSWKEMNLELARQCIQRWTTPEGHEPLKFLQPKDGRKELVKYDGLSDFLGAQALQFAEETAEEWAADRGN